MRDFTSNAILMCEREQAPRHHVFIKRHVLRTKGDYKDAQPQLIANLIFRCQCGSERVWGNERA
jgi:uncharacterized membrane protein